MESFSEEEYFYKVENMVLSSAHILRKLFAERWKKTRNKDWEHTKAQGIIFMHSREGNSIRKWTSPKQINLISEKGCLADMDVTLLATMVRSFKDQMYKKENKAVSELTELRNNQHHHPSGKLSKEDYKKKVKDFKKILGKLHVDSKEIEKIIEKAGITSSVDALEAATELLKQAYKHMEAKQFKEATDCYNEAITMPSLPPTEKGVVYEKLAECLLEQAEFEKNEKGTDSQKLVEQALVNASLAVEFNDSSSNAHYLVAKCHQEKAKTELDLCNRLSRKRGRNVDESKVRKLAKQEFSRAASQGGKTGGQKYTITIVELEELLENESTSSLPSSSSWTSWLKPNARRKALVFCTDHIENLKLDGLTDGAVDEMEALNALEKDTTNSMQSLVVKTSDTANFIEKIGSTSRQIVIVTEETKADIQEGIKKINDLKADEIRWSDLTRQFAQEIEERNTIFQNTPFQLRDLLKLLGNDVDNLVRKLNGTFLTSLILDQSPPFFKNSIPPSFPYYIPRQILSQARISKEILKKELSDIFLFSGVRLHELSTLVGTSETGKWRPTDTSTNQIKDRNVRVRFIVLFQNDYHFEKISDLTSDPVHWLQYENGGLTWVKSRGNMDSLYNYKLVDGNEKQSRFSEKEFVDYLYSDKPVNRSKMPVCIADTPGMGKSSLLASIGRAFISRDPRKLALFANLTEVVAHVKGQVRVASDLSEKVLINVLSNFLNNHDNELAIFLFTNGLKNGTLNMELLLDGYDEVNTQDLELANDCLRCLVEKFKSVRVIVSTRPHLLLSLENILQTVGFKIESFSKQDQIEFLMKFWKAQQQPDKVLDNEKLEKFGLYCLNIMEKKISANDRNIAGIPLICLLIAEVYQENAVNYADKGNKDEVSAPVDVVFISITDLFKHVVEKKFGLYYTRHQLDSSSSDKLELMNAHIVESLRVLFPNNSNIPKEWAQEVSGYPTETLLKVGILEKGSTEQAPRFIHRSFADYFVALLAVDKFKEKKEKDGDGVDEVTNFIFSVLLCTTAVEPPNYYTSIFQPRGVLTFASTFTFQVAAYFINDQVHSLPTANFKDVSQQVGRSDISLACTHDDHVQLFRYLLKSKFFELDKHILLSINFLLVMVRKSSLSLSVSQSVSMLDLLEEEFDEFENKLSEFPHQLLHTAAKRGVYTIFERLCSYQRFKEVVEQYHVDMDNLLEATVENTWEASSQLGEEIEQRIRIVHRLIPVNGLLSDQHESLVAMFYKNIHICILLELLKFLVPGESDMSTVLQDVAYYLTDEQFHMFVQNIPKAILQEMLKTHDENDQEPLRLRLMNSSQPLPTLLLLSNCGFNLLDPGYLESPFTYERSGVCLRTLIHFWHNWYCLEQGQMYSALHHAAREINRKLVELFLSFGMDVNDSDLDGNTPIFYAVESDWDTRAQLEVLEELIKSGAELTKSYARNQTLLHVAVQGNKPDIVKFLLKNGLAAVLDAQDRDGDTPLHAAVQGRCDHEIISLLVEWGADVNVTNYCNHTPIMGLLRENNWSKTRLPSMALFISKGAKMSKQSAALALKVVVSDNGEIGQPVYVWLANKCLEKGGDLEEIDVEGQSLLHHAATNHCPRGAQFLLRRGLKPNLRDNEGNTPLHLAISTCCFQNGKAQFQLAKVLVDADSSIVNVCNKSGETALSAATTHVQNMIFIDSKLVELLQCPPETARKIMKLIIKANFGTLGFNKELANTLIKCGAELNWKTESGTTWLHMAMTVNSESPDALRFFVERGIHPNVKDNLGNTPSHHALASLDNHSESLTYVVYRLRSLIQLGANVKAVNSKGESLLHFAVRGESTPAVEYLLSMGCDVNAPGGSDGDTVLHYCFMKK